MQKKQLHMTVRHALKQYKRYKRKYSRIYTSDQAPAGRLQFLRKRMERLKAFLQAAFKKSKLVTSAGALTLLLSANTAEAQTFNAPVTNPFGTSVVNGYSAPAFADLDDDGDLDLLMGSYYAGDFSYFQNTGTAIAPAYAAPMMNPFGLTDLGDYSFATPTFADLDGDGDFDMMAGSNNGDGNIYYFQNTGTASAPAFAAPQTNPFGITIPTYTYTGYYGTYTYSNAAYSDPHLKDLDGDGDLDMMVGNDSDGDLYYYENTGTVMAPAFAAPVENPFGLTNFDNGTTPVMIDFDGDGDLDLFSGEGSGNVYYIENTGTSIAPAFGTEALNPFTGLADVGSYTNLEVQDIDGDGDLDIFAGAADGNLYFFEQICVAPPAPADATPTANLTICEGNSTTLNVTGTGTISWYDASSGGTYLGSGSAFITPLLSTGTTFFAQDSTCGQSATRTPVVITVNPLPNVATTTAGPTATATLSGATSYQWVTCPSFAMASGTSTNQSYSAPANGDYAVIITDGGCTDTSTCVTINSVGMTETGKEQLISAFPNPSNGSFTIQSTVGGNYTLLNDLGETIRSFTLDAANGYTLNMQGLSNGVYFITGVNDQSITRHKVVVTK